MTLFLPCLYRIAKSKPFEMVLSVINQTMLDNTVPLLSNIRALISGGDRAETSQHYVSDKEERQSKMCSEAIV